MLHQYDAKHATAPVARVRQSPDPTRKALINRHLKFIARDMGTWHQPCMVTHDRMNERPGARAPITRGSAMSNVKQFDMNNWDQEVLKSDSPVLVDFWAPWCGPCKMIGPVIEELATDYDGKVKVGKVNVDDNQQLAGQHGIRGIPTVMLFKGGEMVESFVGLQQKGDLASAIDKHV
jgi:thioredoxin 1